MKEREGAFLQLYSEINKNISATNQVETRKRRIRSDVLPGKCAKIAHTAVDLVCAIQLFKKTLQPLR